jgi:hypothetical protein
MRCPLSVRQPSFSRLLLWLSVISCVLFVAGCVTPAGQNLVGLGGQSVPAVTKLDATVATLQAATTQPILTESAGLFGNLGAAVLSLISLAAGAYGSIRAEQAHGKAASALVAATVAK